MKRVLNSYFRNLLCGWGGMVVMGLSAVAMGQAGTPGVVQDIRTEAARSLNDPIGRPLPLASHWNTNPTNRAYNGPGYQMGLIEDGHHFIPTVDLPDTGESLSSVERSRVQTYAQWDIPISVNGGNWHARLRRDRYANLPDEQNPLLLRSDGNGGTWIQGNRVDPLGPIKPWTDVGQRLVNDSPGFTQLQALYPNPSRVILLSNNETSRISADDANDSLRYTRQNGEVNTNMEKNEARRIVGEGYADRFGALIGGIKTSLSPEWQNAVKVVGYNSDRGEASFAPTAYGRYGGWVDVSTATYGDGVIDRSHLPWDGASVSYYTPDYNAARDYRVYSPQIQWQNVPFELNQALEDNPDFWLEQSVWDGAWGTNPVYADNPDTIQDTYLPDGQTYTPARYAGYAQYGMWLTTPRVVREFKGSSVYRDDFPGRFEALLDNVDRVYENDILQRFWRKSALVVNTNSSNPYDANLLPALSDQPRWFFLDTDANTEFDRGSVFSFINVYSLARVLGDPGEREWLLYAYAPRGDEEDVTISLPGFGDVVVDATVGGSFYLIDEASGSVSLVPEPTSLMLLGGMSGLMLMGRRRRRQTACAA